MATGQLSGKIAIITGGGRGIGRAMALGLAAAGSNVLITAASNPTEIERVARDARDAGAGAIIPLTADVTSEMDCRRVVETSVHRFGGLHILINNAACGMRFISESFLENPPSSGRATLRPGA